MAREAYLFHLREIDFTAIDAAARRARLKVVEPGWHRKRTLWQTIDVRVGVTPHADRTVLDMEASRPGRGAFPVEHAPALRRLASEVHRGYGFAPYTRIRQCQCGCLLINNQQRCPECGATDVQDRGVWRPAVAALGRVALVNAVMLGGFWAVYQLLEWTVGFSAGIGDLALYMGTSLMFSWFVYLRELQQLQATRGARLNRAHGAKSA